MSECIKQFKFQLNRILDDWFVMGFLLKEEKENLLTEYNGLREEIMDRDYKTWVINAILVIGSLLAALTPPIENFNGAILSIILLLGAMVLQGTSERVNKIGQHRIEEIAKQLRITGPTRMYETKIADQWWYTARRNVAYALFIVLISVYLFLVFNNIYILAITIFAGFLLLTFKEGLWKKQEQNRNDNQKMKPAGDKSSNAKETY